MMVEVASSGFVLVESCYMKGSGLALGVEHTWKRKTNAGGERVAGHR